MKKTKRVCLVDDHKLFRKGMVELVNGFNEYEVIWEANDGHQFIGKLTSENQPDIILLDINMPGLNGPETARWIKDNFPRIKILALSMYDDEKSIIKMIKAGAHGYILKDAEPQELRFALDEVSQKGYFYSEIVSQALIKNMHDYNMTEVSITDREREFLKLACTELTYKEIADQMCLAPRTIDGYRETLFEKLKVKSRVGLVIYAIRNKIIKFD